jgi:uncharacterized membrane protein
MEESSKSKRELIRVGKHLKEIVTIKDSVGNIVHQSLRATMVEVYPRDIMQLIVGATLLSIPVAFTEEVWGLGGALPWVNVLGMVVVSLTFISLFVYYNFYRHHFDGHKKEFIKRIVLIYGISLLISMLVLILIDKAPFGEDFYITFKRMVILSFPASMSAAVADMLK